MSDKSQNPLRIAIPSKGRLEEPACDLLRQAGFRFERTERSLTVPVAGAPIELLFVRTKDIPEMVADQVADLGITGIDITREQGIPVDVILDLGFGRCSLVAAVPENSPIVAVEDFNGARIATSHPGVVGEFFASKSIDMHLVALSGSVEVAPKLGIADAVVDLVSSGSTMLVNGLRPVVTVLESSAILIESITSARSAEAEMVSTMLTAAVAARNRRYVVMNAPVTAVERIARIIPGIESPTVVPLTTSDMVAIHSVVDASDVWRVLPAVKAEGATGILVLPVQQVLA
jgi:ATP phosphoribosyltransferase